MTKVTIIDNDGFEMVCDGHAGTDAVCNAVSTLCYSIDAWATDAEYRKSIEKYSFQALDGNCRIFFHRVCGEPEMEHFIVLAMENLQYNFPEQVQVEVKHEGA